MARKCPEYMAKMDFSTPAAVRGGLMRSILKFLNERGCRGSRCNQCPASTLVNGA